MFSFSYMYITFLHAFSGILSGKCTRNGSNYLDVRGVTIPPGFLVLLIDVMDLIDSPSALLLGQCLYHSLIEKLSRKDINSQG